MTSPFLADRWLRSGSASVYAGYRSRQGFLAFAGLHGIIPIRRGRFLLWDRLDIDAALLKLKSHGSSVTRHAA